MSEKIFKPVADVFALIHAGGEPYSWTKDPKAAVDWLKENPKYSVKEYVTLQRYQECMSDDVAGLQQKLDALAAENARMLEDYREIPEMRRIGAPLTPATDAYLNAVRAEALRDFAKEADKKAEAFSASARATNDFSEDQRFRFAAAMFRGFARQLRTAQLRAGNAGK